MSSQIKPQNSPKHTSSSYNAVEKMKKQLYSGKLTPKSITAMILFGAIVLVFVFFGLPRNGAGVGAVARVNNSYISLADLQSEASRMEQMYGRFMGAMGGGDAQRQFIRQQALENLVNSELVAQVAEKRGIFGTDQEIQEFVMKEMPAFQRDGRFQKDLYQQILQANRLTPAEFEKKIRRELQSQRMRRMIEISSAPMSLEIAKERQVRSTKVNYAFVKINKDILSKSLKISDSEIKQKLANAEFMAKVKSEFESNKALYSKDEEIKAQHILIKAEAGNKSAEEKALTKIKSIQARLAKEDFGKVASETSEDTGSKSSKGDLGWFGKGRMVPEFEKAAFSQKVGVVGEPVKTAYGFHLIKVNDRKAAVPADISLWQNEIAKKLYVDEKMDGFIKSLEAELAKKDSKSLDSWLSAQGLKWEETGFVQMGSDAIPKLGSSVASSSAMEATKENPILGRVVRDAEDKFVIKWKDLKIDVVDEKQLDSQLSKERSYDSFSNLIESEKSQAKIEKNEQILLGR